MKLYSSKPQASITMGISPALRQLLAHTIGAFRPGVVIESGTYVGLGSTTLLAELLQETFPEHTPRLFTLEVSFAHWQQAARNLRRFRHVRCLWGLSVDRGEARRFILNDPVLNRHESEPDIYVDNVEDPVRFYLDEVDGKLLDPDAVPGDFIRKALFREQWLPRLLGRYGARRPLVTLDSAGGIGFLEFNTVTRLLKDHPYLLLLDDIDHLKHFRSRRAVHADPCFEVLGEEPETGWLLARHNPARGA
ncbi:hypothetical protein GALL_115770 [mine drainage metagenome]|uniref:Uncharacterized protein n=1 Tax=mine drainage metagenome TaxID=410659 RepID=A0A1J5SEP3_9ZZZZ